MSACAIRNSEGRRCRKQATAEIPAFLDNESYDYEVRWVWIRVCSDHLGKFGSVSRDEARKLRTEAP